jgi:hypothetical protein
MPRRAVAVSDGIEEALPAVVSRSRAHSTGRTQLNFHMTAMNFIR